MTNYIKHASCIMRCASPPPLLPSSLLAPLMVWLAAAAARSAMEFILSATSEDLSMEAALFDTQLQEAADKLEAEARGHS
jgi:hypothetical protein